MKRFSDPMCTKAQRIQIGELLERNDINNLNERLKEYGVRYVETLTQLNADRLINDLKGHRSECSRCKRIGLKPKLPCIHDTGEAYAGSQHYLGLGEGD